MTDGQYTVEPFTDTLAEGVTMFAVRDPEGEIHALFGGEWEAQSYAVDLNLANGAVRAAVLPAMPGADAMAEVRFAEAMASGAAYGSTLGPDDVVALADALQALAADQEVAS